MPAALRSRIASVGVIYRPFGGEVVETTLERVSVEELMAAGPVREFRWHRYAPMVPTSRGQRLLDHLARPDIRELLRRYADANARPKCGPYRRSAQQ